MQAHQSPTVQQAVEHILKSVLRCSGWRLGVLFLVWGISVHGQYYYGESFAGTTAPGWVFLSNTNIASNTPGNTQYDPYLTATHGAFNDPTPIDANGSGWLRLTENTTYQSTMAYYQYPIAIAGAQIQISFDFAVYNQNGTSAEDGFTFFLADGSGSSPQPGAYGGSLGYAQRNNPYNLSGMTGGWLGVGFDIYGNYSNPTEGRSGGTGSTPESVALRGGGNGLTKYTFLTNSTQLGAYGGLNFSNYTSRPVQTGVDYRHADITINNINSTNTTVTVAMTFGVGNSPTVVVNSYTDSQTISNTLIFGFTGATGPGGEITEIHNYGVISSVYFTGAVIPELSSFSIAALALLTMGAVHWVVSRRKRSALLGVTPEAILTQPGLSSFPDTKCPTLPTCT